MLLQLQTKCPHVLNRKEGRKRGTCSIAGKVIVGLVGTIGVGAVVGVVLCLTSEVTTTPAP